MQDYTLNKGTIFKALARLDEILCAKEVYGEVCIFGGAAMLLAFDGKFTTRDVDAIFVPKTIIMDAIALIAEEMNLPISWLNDGVKGFVSEKQDYTTDGMPQFPNLRVIRPTAAYLLAMKCMASRVAGYGERGDFTDIKKLCDHLQLHTTEDVMRVVLDYYPQSQINIKTQYFIEEVLQS